MILTKTEKVQIHKTTGFCQPTLKYLAPEKTLSMSKKLHGWDTEVEEGLRREKEDSDGHIF